MSSGTSSVVQIRREDLKVVKKIGEGGFSCVYHVIWTNKMSGDTMDVAAKKLHEIEKHEQEVLSQLSHPNIIKLVGVVSDVLDYMLILELCENGSLRAYIDEHGKKPLPPGLFDTWSKQAAQAIKYLQEHNIIHKDIKSQNYVISSDMILKLTDFGLSKKADFTFSCATQRGTYGYMAPELLKDFKLSPMKYDIFSLGVVIWEMITGKIPYEGMEYVAIVMHVCKANKRPEIPSDCPEYIAKLLNGCWLADHKLRPDIHQVLATLEAKECKSTNNWTLQSQFGHQEDLVAPKLQKASAIAVSKDGDVAVYDFATDSTHVYTNEGHFKLSFGSSSRPGTKGTANRPCIPRPLVAGPNGNFFLRNDSQHVEMYGSNGKETITLLPPKSSAKLGGLAFDTNGHLLVGVYDYQEIARVLPRQRSAGVKYSMDAYAMDSDSSMYDSRDDYEYEGPTDSEVGVYDYQEIEALPRSVIITPQPSPNQAPTTPQPLPQSRPNQAPTTPQPSSSRPYQAPTKPQPSRAGRAPTTPQPSSSRPYQAPTKPQPSRAGRAQTTPKSRVLDTSPEVSGQRYASVSSMDDSGDDYDYDYENMENVSDDYEYYVTDLEELVRRVNFILVLKEFNDVKADLEGIVKIPVSIQPGFLAVTPLDTIVVASLPRLVSSSLRNSWMQIIDERGEVLRNLIDPPPGVTRLRVTGVCCRLDTIFITNDYRDAPNEYGVYCYSLSGEYLGCATKEVLNPVGKAISEDVRSAV